MYLDSGGASVRLGPSLGRGAEGEVFEVSRTGLVAKILHLSNRTPERRAKLRIMMKYPPKDPTHSIGHPTLCWPCDLLFERSELLGFLMPRLDMGACLPLYKFLLQQLYPAALHWGHQLEIAANLAGVLTAIHAEGYVVGDLNFRNIYVTQKCLVTLIDCDSMQVRDPVTGRILRCPVGMPEYMAPELQNIQLDSVDRSEASDSFAFGVMASQLLLAGTHPFAGGRGQTREENILNNDSFLLTGSVPRGAPAPTILPPPLLAVLMRCFRYGFQSPQLRPRLFEFERTLASSRNQITHCKRSPNKHVYARHLAVCPWCELARQGLDPYQNVIRQGPSAPQTARAQVTVATTAPPTPIPSIQKPGSGVRVSTIAGLGALVILLVALGWLILISRQASRTDASIGSSTAVDSPPIDNGPLQLGLRQYSTTPFTIPTWSFGGGAGIDCSLVSVSVRRSETVLRFRMVGGPRPDLLLYEPPKPSTPRRNSFGLIIEEHFEELYLLDDTGAKLYSLQGFEGGSQSSFNNYNLIRRVNIGLGEVVDLEVRFPPLNERASTITFVSPILNGWQSEWRWSDIPLRGLEVIAEREPSTSEQSQLVTEGEIGIAETSDVEEFSIDTAPYREIGSEAESPQPIPAPDSRDDAQSKTETEEQPRAFVPRYLYAGHDLPQIILAAIDWSTLGEVTFTLKITNSRDKKIEVFLVRPSSQTYLLDSQDKAYSFISSDGLDRTTPISPGESVRVSFTTVAPLALEKLTLYTTLGAHGARYRGKADLKTTIEGPIRDYSSPESNRSEQGILDFSVVPDDASVYLDGLFLGTGKELTKGIPVTAGKHRFAVVRPGFRSYEAPQFVEPGQRHSIAVTLVPTPQ